MEEGAAAFAGFYEAGEELDPITLVLVIDDAQLPGGGTTAPGDADPAEGGPATGGRTPPTVAAAAGELPRTGTPWTPGIVALGLVMMVAGAAATRLRTRA